MSRKVVDARGFGKDGMKPAPVFCGSRLLRVGGAQSLWPEKSVNYGPEVRQGERLPHKRVRPHLGPRPLELLPDPGDQDDRNGPGGRVGFHPATEFDPAYARPPQV